MRLLANAWRASPAATAVRWSRGLWRRAPHLDLVSRKVSSLAERPLRLLVSLPPQHGKSELLSHWTPVWFLSNWPHKRVGLASYAAEFAAGWGRKARDSVMATPELGISVRQDLSGASMWELTAGGGMMTAGVGGPFTGHGFDLLIIDDPIKNRQEADSVAVRGHLWEWWRSTARTRLRPQGSVIIVQTRWHEDDLVGQLLSSASSEGDDRRDEWEHIKLPAMAEIDDPLGRDLDEPLWPERYDAAALAMTRLDIGPQEWVGLYQQRPSAMGGSVFLVKDFRYFRMDASSETYLLTTSEGARSVKQTDCHRFCTVDTAETIKKRSDYTVAATWAVTPERDLLLLDLVRTRLETPDIAPLLSQVYQKWKPGYMGVEGKSVFQAARRAGLPVRELKPEGDKWARARPASARMSAGSVYFLAGASWLHNLEEELMAFPTGSHDDQVDCLSYAAREVALGRNQGSKVRARIL